MRAGMGSLRLICGTQVAKATQFVRRAGVKYGSVNVVQIQALGSNYYIFGPIRISFAHSEQGSGDPRRRGGGAVRAFRPPGCSSLVRTLDGSMGANALRLSARPGRFVHVAG